MKKCPSVALADVLKVLLLCIKRITHTKFCHGFCNQDKAGQTTGTQEYKACKCEQTVPCNRDPYSLSSCPRITFRSLSHRAGITGKMLMAMPMGGW